MVESNQCRSEPIFGGLALSDLYMTSLCLAAVLLWNHGFLTLMLLSSNYPVFYAICQCYVCLIIASSLNAIKKMKAKLLKNRNYVRVRNFWLFSMKTVNFAICKILELFFWKPGSKLKSFPSLTFELFFWFVIFLQTINWCYESV